MAYSAEQLRSKSNNLKNGIKQLIEQLRVTNADIVAQVSANEKSIEQINAQHEVNIAKLRADNEALNSLITENDAFISKVEEILGN